tara:strand:+ start:256 stop:930 length:675 start_codon:yes stop_codon:yes gene_type:complete
MSMLVSEEWSVSVTTSAVTLLALGFATYVMRRRRHSVVDLPGKLREEGSLSLKPADFGAKEEMLRDCQRAVEAGGVLLLREGSRAPERLALQAEARSWESAFAAALGTGTLPLPPPLLERLVPMLSVGPALGVLLGAECVPSFRHHRFVVVVREGMLRTHTLGVVGMPGEAQFLLTIRSPNLLHEGSDAINGYTVTYTCTSARRMGPQDVEKAILSHAPEWLSN